MQADRLLRGRDDRREREQDAAVPARSDRPRRLVAIGEDGGPESSGREHAREQVALERGCVMNLFRTQMGGGGDASVEKRHH